MLKFGSLGLIFLLGALYSVIIWRANKPRERLFYVFTGLIITGPLPLLLVWLVSYGYVPAHHSAYAMLVPATFLVVFLVSIVGSVFRL